MPRNTLEKLLGGGLNDQLPALGALGLAARQAIDEGGLELLAPMQVWAIRKAGGGLAVDRISVAAGFRPDLDPLCELRLDLDAVVEAPTALAPLIDPNLHCCGTVPPHGVV